MGESYSQSSTQPYGEAIAKMPEETEDEMEMPPYWGRLYPAQENVKFHDLTKDEISVGKLKSCDICLKSDEVSSDVLAVMSRHHFSIVRTAMKDKFGAITYKIKIKDFSMNGTYVNGLLVGRNNARTLKDKNIISVGRPQNEVYYFKDAIVNESLPNVLQKKYDIGVRLGTGAFGEVSLVFCKETGKVYAMKSIIKAKSGDKRKLAIELQKLDNEVKILRKIKHPNVIQLVDVLDCDTQKYLFLEMMRGKDLFHRITLCKRLTETQAKLYFYQIASGVQYLHGKGIIHRDLKPENVLLETNAEETVVKITDFGLSKVLISTTYLRSLCGTKLYVAPEVLESGGSKRYTDQVDVWSMGVILFVCLSGTTPFCNERNGKTMEEQIKSASYKFYPSTWECVSADAQSIVKKMMTLNPTERISVGDIFKDPWLQDQLMLDKVNKLLLVKKNVTRALPQGKENLPKRAAADKEFQTCGLPSHQDIPPSPLDADRDFPASPIPANLKIMSPPMSPLRKRARMIN